MDTDQPASSGCNVLPLKFLKIKKNIIMGKTGKDISFVIEINLTLNMLGNLAFFFTVFCMFSKSIVSKNYFMNTTSVSNKFVPDQVRHFVSPDLGPNCLQI